MSPLEIVVRGVARRKFRPERAILYLTVHREGWSRESVYRDAATVHGAVVESLKDLLARDVIDEWSSDTLRVFSYRPYDGDGHRQDPAYSTRIRIDAVFTDFEELSKFIDRWAAADGVDVGNVEWAITQDNRRTYERDLRREAVDDAVAKAQAYSDAVGRGAVTATQLADPNMLSDSGASMVRAASIAAPGAAPALELRSEDIEIAVAVDARFLAS
ncbi:SIMPL domain-containing protein [Gordonia hankookensis]|uniref:SIMPL domain-containing protein n=1 Tax=Gordonia hankookensis TaxID=589403 RepID=A0ABR7WH97_9ACTN|nr:SIMPL domain-containing protein [Gordonia hankookensis]MBD1321257.1 SIMPL domain-containing protein [Gordonia hankookensis]